MTPEHTPRFQCLGSLTCCAARTTPNVTYYDLNDYLCGIQGYCSLYSRGLMMYMSNNHLSYSGHAFMGRDIVRTLGVPHAFADI